MMRFWIRRQQNREFLQQFAMNLSCRSTLFDTKNSSASVNLSISGQRYSLHLAEDLPLGRWSERPADNLCLINTVNQHYTKSPNSNILE